METEVRLPQWGMGMREGIVVAWLKQVGDPVEEGEPLVEIEAEKVTQTIEAPASGVVSQILVEPDRSVPVLTLLAVISTPGG